MARRTVKLCSSLKQNDLGDSQEQISNENHNNNQKVPGCRRETSLTSIYTLNLSHDSLRIVAHSNIVSSSRYEQKREQSSAEGLLRYSTLKERVRTYPVLGFDL